MPLSPREVVVVVDAIGFLRAEDVEHGRADRFTSRVRKIARDRHGCDVILARWRRQRQQRRRRVHVRALARVHVERAARRDVQKPGGGLVAEAARAEVDPHPQVAGLVLEYVDVMIAPSNGPELPPREVQEPALAGDRRMRDRVEHGVIADRFVVVPSHAEGDATLDFVRDAGVFVRRPIGRSKIRADGEVPAGDVISNARR